VQASVEISLLALTVQMLIEYNDLAGNLAFRFRKSRVPGFTPQYVTKVRQSKKVFEVMFHLTVVLPAAYRFHSF
jgi:hypothetical protein